MIITTLIPLSQAQKYSTQQVGKKAVFLAKLLDHKIPLPAGFIIPLETFKNIAHHNGLIPRAEMIFETADWSTNLIARKNLSRIKRLIKKQVIPQDIATTIARAYQKIAHQDFVKIVTEHSLSENIKGETNLMESILALWASSITKDKLFPKPQIILAQTQPGTSGRVTFTAKYTLTIQAVWGVFAPNNTPHNECDFFSVDVRTLNLTSRQINPKKHQFKRVLDKLEKTKSHQTTKASLTDKQITKLAKLAITANLQFMGNKKIYFEIAGSKIIISDIQDEIEFDLASTASPNFNPNSAQPILIGQSITGGYIENYPYLITSASRPSRLAQKASFPTGQILVTTTLTYQDLDLITKASAIICEDKTLDKSILFSIKEHSIPCVIGATYALSKLQTKPKISVDAGTGKIFLSPPAVAANFCSGSNSTSPATTSCTSRDTNFVTATKIYLSAGNPYQADTYPTKSDGIFLKSDYGIAFLGFHPEHLIKTKKNLFERNLSQIAQTFLELKPHSFFYRSCNLNSAELSFLKFSTNYEQPEPNPYLGTRGALKILQNPALFTLELQTIFALAEKTNQEINFVIPFVRTATELAIIFKKIAQIIPHTDHLKFWLQLNTPANVFNLKEFLHLPIAGIVFQAQTIHDLSYGLDPDNPDLQTHYSFDANLTTELLETCAINLASHLPAQTTAVANLPLIVKLNHFNAQLVTTAAKLGVRAIVVKPILFDIVKQQVIQTENQLIYK